MVSSAWVIAFKWSTRKSLTAKIAIRLEILTEVFKILFVISKNELYFFIVDFVELYFCIANLHWQYNFAFFLLFNLLLFIALQLITLT